MRREGGFSTVLLGGVLLALLVGTIVVVLALSGHIQIEGLAPRKVAGKLEEVGRFNAGAIVVTNVVGDVRLVESNVSGVVVRSNIPLNASYRDGLLTVYCPDKKTFLGRHNVCSDYRNGTVVIEVGSTLADVWFRGLVGNVEVDVDATRIIVEDMVGDLVSTPAAEYRLEDVVGDVSIVAGNDVTIKDVVGDVAISVPVNLSVQLNAEDIVGDVRNSHSGEGMPILITVSDVVGDVEVGNDF
ncbi:hypothetical protein FH039_10690 [Thermococcus indicus]|uniref:Adhesin domain-containing protein n=1 Tax=Thermococcus indicus TaxID=2586643 RepID=A0A4Y5SPE8_9EURY|nr:hypothetical protein [Thermococcus indicus]QDA31981.1 hypothetical protein FH039_10690 [Thermococcus indicus]